MYYSFRDRTSLCLFSVRKVDLRERGSGGMVGHVSRIVEIWSITYKDYSYRLRITLSLFP